MNLLPLFSFRATIVLQARSWTLVALLGPRSKLSDVTEAGEEGTVSASSWAKMPWHTMIQISAKPSTAPKLGAPPKLVLSRGRDVDFLGAGGYGLVLLGCY